MAAHQELCEESLKIIITGGGGGGGGGSCSSHQGDTCL